MQSGISQADMHTTVLEQFRTLVHEIHDLGAVQGLLSWDLETHMPEKGALMRSRQMGTLAKLVHNLMTGTEMDEHMLLLRKPELLDQMDATDRALVTEVGRSYDKSRKIPLDLLQAMVETTTEAHKVWVDARQEKDFKGFEPYLEKIVRLNREMADHLGYETSPYNALLDDYERGLTVEQLDPLFGNLKRELVPLLDAIRNAPDQPDTQCLQGHFPAEKQLDFARRVLEDMGFDFSAGRLDLSPHPFSSGSSTDDVRLTTRVHENDVFSALSSAMHEGGHGMYDQGINPALNRTPLGEGTSLGIHESQSRMWENQVGKSKAFWQFYFPKLQTLYPDQMGKASFEDFYRAINQVKPSYIRVESDEVTYNLHILLRYEIEKQLIQGDMKVAEVPEAWNAKMREYLGITPPDAALGALQDIHWSHGSFGYFPTYTLGNLYSAQFFAEANRQMPDLKDRIARGELLPLKNWLNKNIHWVGKTETAEQIVQRVTGQPLQAKYFIDYLWDKFGGIYNIKRPA